MTRSIQRWCSFAGLAAAVVLPIAGPAAAGAPPAYLIAQHDAAGDFDAPVSRVEDITYDSLAGRWCVVNDSTIAFGCTTKSGAVLQTLTRTDFQNYLASEGVTDPQLYVRETEIVGYDAQGDSIYVANNVNGPSLCTEPGTTVRDLAALYQLTRSSPSADWEFNDFWLLPSMNSCPGFPALVFHYAGIIVVNGVVYFHTDKNFTSAGGESVVRGLYEFDLAQNDFVDLDTADFAYSTGSPFVAPRRVEYDSLEGQVYAMKYQSATPGQVRVLQIDWPSRTEVIENDLNVFGKDPPVSGFLHASRGLGVDSAAQRMRIGNNDSTDPNALLFVMSVPEPGSTMMLLSGLGALAVAKRARGLSVVASRRDADREAESGGCQ